jgi:hypothetical protein
MKKIIFYVGSGILIVGAGFFALNSYIYQKKQSQEPNAIVPYPGTLTGEYTCLKLKDSSKPQTLECIYGLKTNQGEFYALDFNSVPSGMPNLKSEERITVTGTITPIEMISADYWQKYDVKGIMSVTGDIQ